MSQNPPEIRQTMACGYLPPAPSTIPVMPGGRPPGYKPASKDEEQAGTCIGYVVKLPEVIEVSRARLHWDKGTLRSWAGGEPTPALLLALEELECQSNACQGWVMEQARKGRS